MWEDRFNRFPEHPPVNKEYYLLRSMFEEFYPKPSAMDTIPKGLSVACSTPEALSWDPEWQNMHDISGRAVSFHDASDAYACTDSWAESASSKARAVSTPARWPPLRAAHGAVRQCAHVGALLLPQKPCRIMRLC
jgi:hypothetical protein